MKKRFIVLSSLITILLASFPVVLFADEVAQDSSNLHTLSDGVFLDQYFYDNYDLLPYLESDGTQYIDTGVYGSNNLRINIKLSLLKFDEYQSVFGAISNKSLAINYFPETDENARFYFLSGNSNITFENLSQYTIYNLGFDGNIAYLNNSTYEFTDGNFSTSPVSMYVFGRNNGSNAGSPVHMKLYNLSIYDNSNDSYVRYYYPAKAKTSGTLGLYDAISKTFVTSASSTPFSDPTDDKVMDFQIGNFVTSGLGWIDDIFDFVIATPIILFFFAVALAGSVYRWARRVVHF